uniref:Uncharacterized protein n=1 Tax=Chrysotila carterae TaxID=13221 RepID=A0A7S4FAC7_CHRCT|mmetsp:Transcript_30142/g.58190  ORF Transcript_30142/g.58190 Transcript_30142/m.58190 type:complete len:163 (+) Transcript_30142:254-742(+)
MPTRIAFPPVSPSPVSPPPGAGWGDNCKNRQQRWVESNTLRASSPPPLATAQSTEEFLNAVSRSKNNDVSIQHLADADAIPSGLPLGLSDLEKKLWLAIFYRTQAAVDEGMSYNEAVDEVIRNLSKEKGAHSHEHTFGLRHRQSVTTCLKMKQTFRSGDVYS